MAPGAAARAHSRARGRRGGRAPGSDVTVFVDGTRSEIRTREVQLAGPAPGPHDVIVAPRTADAWHYRVALLTTPHGIRLPSTRDRRRRRVAALGPRRQNQAQAAQAAGFARPPVAALEPGGTGLGSARFATSGGTGPGRADGRVLRRRLRRTTALRISSSGRTTTRTSARDGAGMATFDDGRFTRFIHSIENSPFRTKFDDDVMKLSGRMGIGVISDNEDQPLIVRSHLGTYAVVTVGKVANADALAERRRSAERHLHFAEMGGGDVNPTELTAALIDQGSDFAEGIALAQDAIEGSCSMLVLTEDGIYAARDALGRTPIVIRGRRTARSPPRWRPARSPTSTTRSSAELGPGEIVRMTADGIVDVKPRRRATCRSARSSGSTTGTPHRRTRGATWRRSAIAAAPRSHGATGRGGRSGRRHPRLGHRARRGLCRGGGRALPPSVREVHADLAAILHAAGPEPARPRRADEADSGPGARRGQASALLRGLDRPRHAAPGHRPAAVRRGREGGPHAAGVPAAAPLLQVPQLLAVPLRAGPRRSSRRRGGRRGAHDEHLDDFADPSSRAPRGHGRRDRQAPGARPPCATSASTTWWRRSACRRRSSARSAGTAPRAAAAVRRRRTQPRCRPGRRRA